MGHQLARSSRQEIKKHIATIHSANTLSLLQRKISNALLYHAYPELPSIEEHEISIQRLCHIIGYSGHNHAAIKEALKGLIATVIEWNVVDADTNEEDWTASSVIASVNIKGPTCRYAYSPRMRALLYSPAIYGKINLIVQSRFKSSYGLALYENCVRYKGLEATKWFDLAMFRKLMGVPEQKYPIFRDFKRRVLDKSVEEVNAHSDIIITADLKRRGRQVQQIRFLLKERPRRQRMGNLLEKVESSNELPAMANQLITEFKLTPAQANQLLEQYSNDYLEEKIELIKATASYQKKQIKNLAAYFLSAVKENYQQSNQQVIHQQQHQQQVELILAEEEGRQEQQQLYRQKAQALLAGLSEPQRQQLLTQFKQYLIENNNQLALKWFAQHELEHHAVFAIFIQFSRQQQWI